MEDVHLLHAQGSCSVLGGGVHTGVGIKRVGGGSNSTFGDIWLKATQCLPNSVW